MELLLYYLFAHKSQLIYFSESKTRKSNVVLREQGINAMEQPVKAVIH